MSSGERDDLGAPQGSARRAGAEARSLPARRSFSSKVQLEAAKKIRELLRRHLADSGFTQKEIEQQLGLGHGYLSRMLRGRLKLEVGRLFALLDALDLQPVPFFVEVAGRLPRSAGGEPGSAWSLPDHAGLAALVEIELRLQRCEEAFRRALEKLDDG